MALEFGFYNSFDGDRRYNAEQMSGIFEGLITDGVYASVGEKFGVFPGVGLQVLVGTGRAFFKETWNKNKARVPLDLAQPDPVFSRIDAICIRARKGVAYRENDLIVYKGTIMVNPEPPIFPTEEDVHYLPLAYVTVQAGATSISAADIQILVGSSKCPFVTSILQQTDIDILFAQWDAQFKQWWDTIKAILDGDTVGNLLNLLDGKVNKSDVATDADILLSLPGEKWVSAEGLRKNVETIIEETDRVGSVKESFDDLEESSKGKYIKSDGRLITSEDYPLLAPKLGSFEKRFEAINSSYKFYFPSLQNSASSFDVYDDNYVMPQLNATNVTLNIVYTMKSGKTKTLMSRTYRTESELRDSYRQLYVKFNPTLGIFYVVLAENVTPFTTASYDTILYVYDIETGNLIREYSMLHNSTNIAPVTQIIVLHGYTFMLYMTNPSSGGESWNMVFTEDGFVTTSLRTSTSYRPYTYTLFNLSQEPCQPVKVYKDKIYHYEATSTSPSSMKMSVSEDFGKTFTTLWTKTAATTKPSPLCWTIDQYTGNIVALQLTNDITSGLSIFDLNTGELIKTNIFNGGGGSISNLNSAMKCLIISEKYIIADVNSIAGQIFFSQETASLGSIYVYDKKLDRSFMHTIDFGYRFTPYNELPIRIYEYPYYVTKDSEYAIFTNVYNRSGYWLGSNFSMKRNASYVSQGRAITWCAFLIHIPTLTGKVYAGNCKTIDTSTSQTMNTLVYDFPPPTEDLKSGKLYVPITTYYDTYGEQTFLSIGTILRFYPDQYYLDFDGNKYIKAIE